MQFMMIEGLLASEEQRVKENLIAVITSVKPEDWSLFPRMCGSFFETFENTLQLIPVSIETSSTIEVHVNCTDAVSIHTLHIYEAFVKGWLVGK